MGRVFNVSFEFQQRQYNAVVAVSMEKRDLAFNVHVPDQSLYNLLPDGKVTYNSRQGLQLLLSEKNELSYELVGCILRSVENELETAVC